MNNLYTNIVGTIGTVIVIYGYLPQIIHLIKEKCAWGISLYSWTLWLIGGIILLSYSWIKQDMVFTIVQGIHVIAISLTIFYAKRSKQICPHHLKT